MKILLYVGSAVEQLTLNLYDVILTNISSGVWLLLTTAMCGRSRNGCTSGVSCSCCTDCCTTLEQAHCCC